MNEEKWTTVVTKIKDTFEVEEEGRIELDPGYREYIIFNGPLGKIKLENTTRPVVIDKKTTYSHRAGGDVKIDYIYSDTEESHIFKAYKWDEADCDWAPVDASSFSF